MYIFRGETLFLLISSLIVLALAIRHFKNKKQLTYWQYNYRGTIYFLLLAYLFVSSLDWWRLNFSIDTLLTSQGCFVRSLSRGGVVLINNGIKQGYALGENRESDPVLSKKGAKINDCFKIEYYYFSNIPYLYSMEKINELKEID